MTKYHNLSFNSAALSFIIVCSLLFSKDTSGINFNIYEAMLLCTGGLLAFFYYSLSQKEHTNSSLIAYPSTFLLFSLFIVNFQTPINVLLDVAPLHFYLDTTKYSCYLGKVIYIGVISIASFMIGYLNYNTSPLIHNNSKKKIIGGRIWLTITIFFFFLFLININIKEFLTGDIYFGSGAEGRKTTLASYWENYFDVFNTIAIVTYTMYASYNTKTNNLFGFFSNFPISLLLVNAVYLILRGLSGDRGPFIYTTSLFFFSFIYLNNKKINKFIFLAFFIICIFMTAMLNVFRGQEHTTSLESKIQSTIINKNERIIERSISPYTQELSNSINCTFIAISDIENGKTSFKNGLYNLSELFLSIPGSNFVFKAITNIDLWRYNTQEYITVSFMGKDYPFGLGTTAIADLYLDFGIIGIILGFILGGILFKYIDQKIMHHKSLSMFELLFIIKIASMSFYIPRASFSFVISKALYICIIYFVFNTFLSLFLKRKYIV